MATIAEVAAALGVAPEAIERAIAQGKIGRGDLGTLAGDGPPPPPAADGITPAAPGDGDVSAFAMKVCSDCGVPKPLDAFHRQPRGTYGRRAQCIDCVKLAREDPEYRRKKREYDQRRYEEFKALRQYQQAAWYAANRERHKELREAWKAANRLALRQYDARRYARLKAAATDEAVDYEYILERDGFVCHLCGGAVAAHELHFDHVVPLSKGGPHSMTNIKVAHAACNMKKGRKTMEEVALAREEERARARAVALDEVVLQVPMNYPGKYISVNHCYRKGQGGRLHLRREAFTWRRNLKVALDWALVEQGIRAALAGPVTIRIDAEYVDPKHGTDIDNLFKLTWDAAKVALGVDDREFQPETGTVAYGVAVPNLTITVRCRLAGTTTPAGPKPRRARTQG